MNTQPEKRSEASWSWHQTNQRVDTPPSIDALHRHQNPHLGSELDHGSRARQARMRLLTSATVIFIWMLGRLNGMTQGGTAEASATYGPANEMTSVSYCGYTETRTDNNNLL